MSYLLVVPPPCWPVVFPKFFVVTGEGLLLDIPVANLLATLNSLVVLALKSLNFLIHQGTVLGEQVVLTEQLV
jgi:hypothetical protein